MTLPTFAAKQQISLNNWYVAPAAAAIDGYLQPTLTLSSKSSARCCCCWSTGKQTCGQMNGWTDRQRFDRYIDPAPHTMWAASTKVKNVLHVWTGLWEMAGRGRLATGPGRPASLTAWTLTLPAADGWHTSVVDEGRLSEALLAGHGTDTVSSSHEPTLSVTACSTIHSLTVCTHTQPQPYSSDLRHPTPGTCSRGYGLTLQLGLTADVGNGSFQWEVVGVWADVRRASKSCIWYYSKTAPVASHSSTHQLTTANITFHTLHCSQPACLHDHFLILSNVCLSNVPSWYTGLIKTNGAKYDKITI